MIALRRLALASAAGIALASTAADAHADDQARAEELFDEGRRLMQSRATLDTACLKLEESLKLWDRGDTVLNLALCHRRQGRTAAAFYEFDRALTHGIKVRFPEAIVEAQRQRAELATILSRLTVAVPPAIASLDGLAVTVNGQPWPRDRWNTAFITDPGLLRVHAEARGRKPFDAQVDLGPKKDEKTVVVSLQIEPAPPPPPPPPPPAPAAARPLWPFIVGGAGAALGIAAVSFEGVSRAAAAQLDRKCGADRRSCPLTYDYQPARSREVIGYGLFAGLGTGALLALGAAGVGLGLSARAPGKAAPTVSLVLSPTSIGVQSTF